MIDATMMEYRDDRMFVMRLTSDFEKSASGKVSASMRQDINPNTTNPVVLITYRNTPELPAIRVDEFKTYEDAVNYIRRVEPFCPRLSLQGKSPTPIPTWEAHLEWLHASGLKSAAEGDFPLPDWVSSEGNTREIFSLKQE